MITRTTLASLLLLCAPAHADRPRLEIGVAFGGHAFADNSELGVADAMTEPGPTDSALLGTRVGLLFAKRFAAEAEAMLIPTEDDVLGDRATVIGLRTHVRVDLMTGRVRPFVLAGLGMHVIRSSSPQMDDDVDRAYHWGAGVSIGLTSAIDLRIDLRHLIVPDREKDGATSDVEVTAGATYRFGAAKRPLPPPPAIVLEPEPEPAPVIDPDPDRDGFLAEADACPNQPETKNGWKDGDGCPDERIAELAGIGFELDSAKIDIASAPILERAYQILRENPTLSIEIAGHTSAEGDANRNQLLSLSRAEAVKKYLAGRGIAPARILTVGHGSDVPLADNRTEVGRQQNRRIEFRILVTSDLP